MNRPKPDTERVFKEWMALPRCSHPTHEVRKKLASDGAISIWRYCLTCGQKITPAIRKATLTAAEIEALPVWDYELEKAYNRAREELRWKMMDEEKARADAEWQSQYDEYLQSPEWRAKRAKVLQRAKGICEGCLDAPATVVHHLNYWNVMDELLFQLVALCEPCHARCHSQHPEPETPDDAPPPPK